MRAGSRCIRPARADGALVPGGAEPLLVARESLCAEVERESSFRIERGHEGEHRDAFVPELAQMLCGRSRPSAIVDPDEGRGGVARLVDRDRGQMPRERRLDAGIVSRRRVDDEAVYGRPAHGVDRRLAEARVGDEEQAEIGVLHPLGESGEKGRCCGVGELVAQPLGEDQAERAGTTEAQSPRRRIWTRVAELLGGREDTLADVLRDELGAAECLRGASDRHAGTGGDVAEPYAPALLR